MKTIQLAFVGFGRRGYHLAKLSLREENVKIKYICDISKENIEKAERHYGLKYEKFTSDYNEIINDSEVDTVFVTTPDFMHRDNCVLALNAGKNVYLEKPMSINFEGLKDIIDAAKKSKGLLNIGYTLREAPFYSKIREIVASGRLGQIMHVNAWEHLGKDHGADYMRKWHRKASNAGNFLLAKCSHDIDLILWLSASKASKVSSFGGLNYFLPKKEAGIYCSDCPTHVKDSCLFKFIEKVNVGFDAPRTYGDGQRPDLCVYNSDKDVVDNQCVIMEMENGVRASFSLQLFGIKGERIMHIVGSKGHLHGNFEANTILLEIINEKPLEIKLDVDNSEGHGGGDAKIIKNFFKSLRNGLPPTANYSEGFNSTIVCLKIDESLKMGKSIEIPKTIYE
jgi:predicted dehydrogenase